MLIEIGVVLLIFGLVTWIWGNKALESTAEGEFTPKFK